MYQKLLNLQTATFSRIVHEDAMVAVVYKIIQPNGKQKFILDDGFNNTAIGTKSGSLF
jgi:hypothetical protein